MDFRVGVMQLTMEPLDEMLASARAMDEAGMDTIWLAEAYPWWRKHGMEARSSTGVAALMGRATERLTIGWGIIAASTRHPVQAAMDARVVQEAAGPGRFILGFGTSKIFLNNTKTQTRKTLGPMRDAVTIARGVLGGERFDYDGDTWSADVPALAPDAHAPREVPPVYVAATAPKMQALAGEIADGCLTPSITTPDFVRYTKRNVGADIDLGCTVVASIHETDPSPWFSVHTEPSPTATNRGSLPTAIVSTTRFVAGSIRVKTFDSVPVTHTAPSPKASAHDPGAT